MKQLFAVLAKKFRVILCVIFSLLTMGWEKITEYGAEKFHESKQLAAIIESGVWNVLLEPDDMIKEATSLIEKDTENSGAYFQRGVAYRNKGENENAIREFTSAVKIRPDFAEALYFRGIAHAGQGNWNAALRDHDAALALRPALRDARYHRECVWFPNPEWNYGGVSLDRIRRIDLVHSRERYRMALGEFRGERYENALKYFREASESNSLDPEPLNFMAWIRATCPDTRYRDPDQALKLALRAVELRPYPYVHDTLAVAYAANGDFKRAMETEEVAIELLRDMSINENTKRQYLAEFGRHLDAFRNGRRFWESR